MLDTLLYAALIYVLWKPLAMNTIGPLIVWKTVKIPTEITFVPLDEEAFMAERNERFRAYDQDLGKLNFRTIGTSTLSDTQSSSFFRLYWHPGVRVAATVVSIESKAGETTYLEFTQKYTDRTVLNVNNSPQPEAYPAMPFKTTHRLPEIAATLDLLRLHGTLKELSRPDSKAVVLDPAKGFAMIEKHLRRESDTLLEMGLVNAGIDPQGRRALTLRGALLMTFRLAPPWRHLRDLRDKRKRRVLLGLR